MAEIRFCSPRLLPQARRAAQVAETRAGGGAGTGNGLMFPFRGLRGETAKDFAADAVPRRGDKREPRAQES